MAKYDIQVELPSMLYKTWYNKKRSSKNLKVHIPKSNDSGYTFCNIDLRHPNFPTECIETHTVDLDNDLCTICLARTLAHQRKTVKKN